MGKSIISNHVRARNDTLSFHIRGFCFRWSNWFLFGDLICLLNNHHLRSSHVSKTMSLDSNNKSTCLQENFCSEEKDNTLSFGNTNVVNIVATKRHLIFTLTAASHMWLGFLTQTQNKA